jgi:hypothetical protein
MGDLDIKLLSRGPRVSSKVANLVVTTVCVAVLGVVVTGLVLMTVWVNSARWVCTTSGQTTVQAGQPVNIIQDCGWQR